MKKLIIIAVMFCTLFGFNAFAAKEPVTDKQEMAQIINDYYPHLSNYYEEGVITVPSISEETLLDGSTEYNVKYKFVNNYCDEQETNEILKEKYPRLYGLKKMGLIKNVIAIKYADRETGEILTNVVYNRNTARMRKAWF